MFPKTVKKNFEKLAEAYAAYTIEYPHLRGITLAQWALESGWGGTGLASRHNNYAGAKWRKYMAPYGYQVQYDAHDGREWYVHFTDEAAFIAGYWKRLDLEPAYAGWREHTATPEEFINFVGPIWVGTDDADKKRYVRDVLRICNAWKLADYFKTTEIVNEDKDINHLELSGNGGARSGHFTWPSKS